MKTKHNLDEGLLRQVRRLAHAPGPCLLCGAEACIVGVYCPFNPKRRAVMYWLCGDHDRHCRATLLMVEAVIDAITAGQDGDRGTAPLA